MRLCRRQQDDMETPPMTTPEDDDRAILAGTRLATLFAVLTVIFAVASIAATVYAVLQ